jgi:hypothetical protein
MDYQYTAISRAQDAARFRIGFGKRADSAGARFIPDAARLQRDPNHGSLPWSPSAPHGIAATKENG